MIIAAHRNKRSRACKGGNHKACKHIVIYGIYYYAYNHTHSGCNSYSSKLFSSDSGDDILCLKYIHRNVKFFVIVICVGVALKIIQTLYALAGESITIDKAKNKIKQLFKVIIIAVSLSELSDTIVNGYLLSRVDQNKSSIALVTIFRYMVVLFKDLIGAATVMSGSISVVLLIIKLMEIQKASENDIAELKKQAVRIIKIGVLITLTLGIVTMLCDHLGVRLG